MPVAEQLSLHLHLDGQEWTNDQAGKLLAGFTGSEELSRLYRFQAVLFTAYSTSLTPDQFIGHTVAIELRRGETKRFFAGICNRFLVLEDAEASGRSYRIDIVPKLWTLTHGIQCRSFLEKKTSDVLAQILSEHGVAAAAT
ncbi:MAG: contractile injection system protein, VgrG/Pvc8 family, partial [Planctomycetaceae bacterium]